MTVYRVAVEDIEPEYHVAWVLDLPGCTSAGRDRERALAHAPSRIVEYFTWIAAHDPGLPRARGPFQVEVVETFESHPSLDCPEYLVNAFFEDDRRSLAHEDVVAGLQLLAWTRRDLLQILEPVSSEQLHTAIEEGERKTIASILDHVAQAENWYFGHLDLGVDWSSLPNDTMDKLKVVRANTRNQLPGLAGDARIMEYCGERWSARKLLRRTLWHERDHTRQILQLSTRFR